MGHAVGSTVVVEAAFVDPCATVVTTEAPTTAAPAVDPCAPVEETAAPTTAAPTPAPPAPESNPCATEAPEPTTMAAPIDPCAPVEVKDAEGSAKAQGIALLQRKVFAAPPMWCALAAVAAAASIGMFVRSRRATRVTFRGRSVYQQVEEGEQQAEDQDEGVAPLLE